MPGLAGTNGTPKPENGNERLVRGLTHSFAHQCPVMPYARLGCLDDAWRHWQECSETFTNPDPELRHLVNEARAAVTTSGSVNDSLAAAPAPWLWISVPQ